jgi:hypothetical protein
MQQQSLARAVFLQGGGRRVVLHLSRKSHLLKQLILVDLCHSFEGIFPILG